MESVDAEPNLIPVMNLFVAMIPFLLLAVAFFQLGVIPATLPTHTENTSDVEPSRTAITVSIVINDEGFRVTAMNQSLPEAELNSIARTIAKENGQYDFDTLRETLQSLKQRYPDSDTAILLPAERVPFAEIIRVMDTVRETRTQEGGQMRRRPLLPNLVMSRTG